MLYTDCAFRTNQSKGKKIYIVKQSTVQYTICFDNTTSKTQKNDFEMWLIRLSLSMHLLHGRHRHYCGWYYFYCSATADWYRHTERVAQFLERANINWTVLRDRYHIYMPPCSKLLLLLLLNCVIVWFVVRTQYKCTVTTK